LAGLSVSTDLFSQLVEVYLGQPSWLWSWLLFQ